MKMSVSTFFVRRKNKKQLTIDEIYLNRIRQTILQKKYVLINSILVKISKFTINKEIYLDKNYF